MSSRLQGSANNTAHEASRSAMKHIISTAVQMSIANSDGDIDDYVPRLLYNDVPRVYPILNHRDGQPFLPPDYLSACWTLASVRHKPDGGRRVLFTGCGVERGQKTNALTLLQSWIARCNLL